MRWSSSSLGADGVLSLSSSLGADGLSLSSSHISSPVRFVMTSSTCCEGTHTVIDSTHRNHAAHSTQRTAQHSIVPQNHHTVPRSTAGTHAPVPHNSQCHAVLNSTTQHLAVPHSTHTADTLLPRSLIAHTAFCSPPCCDRVLSLNSEFR